MVVGTDTISDMLTRIRNANQMRYKEVEVPASKIKLEIAKILTEEGFISGYATKDCEPNADGTVSSYGPLASMVFTPKESMEHLEYIQQFPELFGKYGITDCYNFDYDEPYFSKDYLGIDKGPTIIMLDNYLSGTTWKYFMQSSIAQRAIKVLKFQSRNFENFDNKKI